MYTLKSIARRGTLLSAAAALVLAAFLPASSAFADALNPLTDRSLTLSSSSPGWSHTDGSENPTYAPPNSGANGQKTGNTFSFKVSTATPIKAMTFQYCVHSAGDCVSPGDDTTPGTDTATTSDLNVVTSSPAEVSADDFDTIVDTDNADITLRGNVKAVPGYAGYNNGKKGTAAESGIGGTGGAVAGNFLVYYLDQSDSTWKISEDWDMTATTNVVSTSPTPAKNNITLTNATGLPVTFGTEIKVVFFGTDTNYITNPGSGAFFVRMNTYKETTALNADIIDGGVTVANVMNQSIWIQTKVLETMEFSVGTVDPNTLDSSDGDADTQSTLQAALGAPADGGLTKHGPCDRILGALTPDGKTNVLQLGNQGADSSLETGHTYSTHSYWRLSSNSSAGATVYYSGHTLTNTVGDEITAVGPTKALPHAGTEQFGLALDNTDQTGTSQSDLKVDYTQEATYENGVDEGLVAVSPSTVTDLTSGGTVNGSWHDPTLFPLLPASNYSSGTGAIDGTSPTAMFAFERTSDTIPVPVASEDSQVVDCVTGKMRYMANIAATTPAGIYTTKINYIAAPQY